MPPQGTTADRSSAGPRTRCMIQPVWRHRSSSSGRQSGDQRMVRFRNCLHYLATPAVLRRLSTIKDRQSVSPAYAMLLLDDLPRSTQCFGRTAYLPILEALAGRRGTLLRQSIIRAQWSDSRIARATPAAYATITRSSGRKTVACTTWTPFLEIRAAPRLGLTTGIR